MALGKGRGKLAYVDMRKDDGTVAGPRSPSLSPCTPEQAMDDYLKKINMYRKPVAKDGSCLFRAVSEQVFFTQALHQQVRADCIRHMHTHRKLFESFIEGQFEHHLFKLRNLKEWGGHSEMTALSLLYKYDFIVYQIANPVPQDVTKNGFDKKIHLCYLNNNHYDCVYPLSFKTSAAISQSILYEILLGNVFAEVDKREMEASKTEYTDENQSVGWTEVKTKQNKGKVEGKTVDSPWEHLISVIPESSKNPRVLRSLKASLDSGVYRNIELDVWETTRTEQQKSDHLIAATHQFKPGDVCIATIRESKDISKQVIVKIQKISPEKCVVFPEDKDTPYYVQLDDLQPMVNGDYKDYRSLPGYYNKYENDQEFQSQKRRKHGRKMRDEERKGTEGNVNQQKGRIEKDNRGNRRNPTRKEKIASPVKPQKENNGNKKVEKPEIVDHQQPSSPTTTNIDGTPVKVAKPAETSAAFWGRMRSNVPPPPATSGIITTPTVPPQTISTPEETKKKTPTIQTNDINITTEPPTLFSPQTTSTAENTKKKTLVHKPNDANPTIETTSQSTPSTPIPLNDSQTKDDNNIKPQTSNQPINSSPHIIQESPVQNTKTDNTASINSPVSCLTNESSAILNEVRENIITMTSAKLEPTKPTINVLSQDPDLITNQSVIASTDSESVRDVKTKLEEVEIPENPPLPKQTSPTFEESVKVKLNKLTLENPKSAPALQNSVETKYRVLTPNTAEISNEKTDPRQKSPKLGKMKKKVSFGSTTEIIEKPQPLLISPSPVSQQDEVHVGIPERGKIHIPRDHIEKHTNPTYPTSTINYSVQYQAPPELNPQLAEMSTQQLRGFPQPTFVQAGHPSTFYQQAPTPQVFPVFYRPNNIDTRTVPTMSQDPEGKDMPDDPALLQYFYNLGVQYYWMHFQPQQNLQVNQPGLLPLPVATPLQQMQNVQQVVLNQEHNRNAEIYVPNSQTNESLLELQQQQQLPVSSTVLSMSSRLQQTPNLQFHHQHPSQNVSFEEYETPPRLRRGVLQPTYTGNILGAPMTYRNTQRYQSPRHMLNGRGIMGQGPKPLRGDLIRAPSNYP